MIYRALDMQDEFMQLKAAQILTVLLWSVRANLCSFLPPEQTLALNHVHWLRPSYTNSL